MRRKYLMLLLLVSVLALAGCGKKHFAPPPVPIAPSNLTAAISSANEISLNWKDNSTIEKGFYVYRRTADDYARLGIMETNATSYNDIGLSAGTTYWYKVTAYNDGGESDPSNEVSVTTPGDPPPPPEPLEPPTGLRADVVSYKLVLLSWKDNSSNEDGFNVRCRMDETVYLTIATVGPNSTSFEHDFLQPMTALEYYVEVYRGDDSVGSEQAYATTPCPVELLYSWMYQASNHTVGIEGELRNDATEACLVELTGHIYDDEGALAGIVVDKVFVEAMRKKYFTIYYRIPMETRGDWYPDYSLEITDVEIDY